MRAIINYVQTKIREVTPKDPFAVAFADCMLWSVPLSFSAALFESIYQKAASHPAHIAYLAISVFIVLSSLMGILLYICILRMQKIQERFINSVTSRSIHDWSRLLLIASVCFNVIIFLTYSCFFENMAISTVEALHTVLTRHAATAPGHGWLLAASACAILWATTGMAAFFMAIMKSVCDLRQLWNLLAHSYQTSKSSQSRQAETSKEL